MLFSYLGSLDLHNKNDNNSKTIDLGLKKHTFDLDVPKPKSK